MTFDVITTKYERDGSQSMHRVETYRDNQPKVLKELATSMKMMDQIKQDKEHSVIKIPAELYYNNKRNNHRKFKTNRNLSEREKESKASGQGYLSSILNPKNVASLQTIELNRCNSNVYI